jgi:hypothetical protein
MAAPKKFAQVEKLTFAAAIDVAPDRLGLLIE